MCKLHLLRCRGYTTTYSVMSLFGVIDMSFSFAYLATAVLALGIGLGTGWFLGLRKRSNRDVVVDLEQRLERALESRADYEAEVTQHFAQTAHLFEQLTSDYRAVYRHMALGADKLSDGSVKLNATILSQNDQNDVSAYLLNTAQPLDYAPKKDPQDQGQLAEDFGIEKSTIPVENHEYRSGY